MQPLRTLICFALAFIPAFGVAQRVPGYAPSTPIELKGIRRTSAEHDVIYAKRPFPYVLDLKVEKGRLVFFGMTHTNDPADPQFAAMATRWAEVRPTVALIESRPTVYRGRIEDAAKRGEPFYVMALAARDGCKLFTMEPPAEAEGAMLAKAENADRALLYLILRGYVGDRRKSGMAPSDALVQFSIARRAKEYGLRSSLKTTADLDALWKEDFPDLADWREIPEQALWPKPEGTYLNRLARLANVFRDDHWARTMVDLVRAGETVFAVGGASHVIIMEPVLRATLQGASDPGEVVSAAFCWASRR